MERKTEHKSTGPLVSDATMKIIINGESKQITNGLTIRQLLAQLNLVPEKVAIELNKRLARSDKYDLPLKEGDEIEIVTFVGGG